MYGICAQRSDGKVLNCVNATKAVKVTIHHNPLVMCCQYNIARESLSYYFSLGPVRNHNSFPLTLHRICTIMSIWFSFL